MLGPLKIHFEGPSLTAEDRVLLSHPQVGGVILFSRNFESPQQLRSLTEEIHGLRDPRLLIAVDQEGGRVQRFRGEFTVLPALSLIGEHYDRDPDEALVLAAECGWLMAAELRAVGVDFSFAPVLDLRTADSAVIGDRAFHADPHCVTRLARAYVSGMRRVPMAAVGKHFPGHGYVAADSHLELPVDDRDYYDIEQRDLVPFRALVASGIEGIMTAHVLFPRVAPEVAGYSPVWIRDTLRGELGFEGIVFSDDLSMAGADAGGDSVERAAHALAAGCDMLLICNNRAAVMDVVESMAERTSPLTQVRIMRMHARRTGTVLADLRTTSEWQRIAARVTALNQYPELDLGDDNLLG